MGDFDIFEAKKLYQKQLLRAQSRFRYYKYHNDSFIGYQEAVRTGGQFSFADVKTESDFITELARIRQFYNLEANYEKMQVEIERRFSEQYRQMFARGISKSERSSMLDLNPEDEKMIYRVYRMTTEENPALLIGNQIYDSSNYLSSLYRGIKQGLTEDELMDRGKEIIERLKSFGDSFDREIPISTFNRYKERGY